MITGRCLCEGVRFEIDGRLGPIIYCHCSMCRRASGSAFAANASVRTGALRVVAGQELIAEVQSSPGTFRGFCSRCGAPLYGRSESLPGLRRVRLGSLEGYPGGRCVANIWVGSKAPWFEITDELERFDEEPPDSYGACG